MLRKILITNFFIISFFTNAQRFKPYQTFGIQLNYSWSYIIVENRNGGGRVTEGLNTLDIYGNYEVGVNKWLGVSSGLGLICRGAVFYIYQQKELVTRQIFYASVPLLVQLKPFKGFWLEGGLQANTSLFHRDVGAESSYTNAVGEVYDGPFDAQEINRVTVLWQAGFRVNLYRGLSLFANYYSDIIPMANQPSSNLAQNDALYQNYGISFGFRYMFNQPKRGSLGSLF